MDILRLCCIFCLMLDRTVFGLRLVSRGKSVTSVGIYDDQPSWTANKSVDGVARRNPNLCNCCAATKKMFEPWYTLDLGQSYVIRRINVLGREKYQNLKNMEIALGNYKATEGRVLAINTNDSFEFDYRLPQPESGRFVKLTLRNTTEFFVICELYVYADCDGKRYGDNCSETCGHCRDNAICDGEDGKCVACAPGFKGDTCHLECDSGYYGQDCKERCGHCLNNDPCDPINGQCEACPAGFKGDKCDEKCDSGYYGQDCKERCGHCLNNEPCDHIHGRCKACALEYKGDKCDAQCDSGYYGKDCKERCGHCLNNEPCDPINGQCEACPAGFKGDKCDEKCDSGYYGQDCKERCGHCLNNEPCDHIHGRCKACPAGFKGDKCDAECDGGYYGQDCKEHCGHCLNNQPCDPINGRCNACAAGYQGDKCDAQCDRDHYGQDCWKRCGHCLNTEPCDPINGRCNECAAGFTGDKCDAKCSFGRYGEKCAGLCGRCYRNETCDPVTGDCKSCARGYKRPKCTDGCGRGTYGENCSEQCGFCYNRAICDHVTGECQRCNPGYRKPKCKEKCGRSFYGQDCKERCGSCLNNEPCDPIDGQCEACAAGFTGDKCDECIFGRYGEKCAGLCGRCLRNETCDPVTGDCRYCAYGYKPPKKCTDECDDGTYGRKCDRQCGKCLDNDVCEKVDGSCKACAAGYMGKRCHKECRAGSYGLNCAESCGNCTKSDQCNHINGSCSDGCASGYHGELCKQRCPGGFYGDGCNSTCGACYNGTNCDPTTGYCIEGCDPGFNGSLCVDKCRAGSYGLNCAEACGNCSKSDQCNHINGSCSDGCASGYHGELCKQKCRAGSYGLNCAESCGNCTKSDQCNHINGSCSDGCASGYHGELCKQTCQAGNYGANCALRCGQCSGPACEIKTGVCLEGCLPGYSDELCQVECEDGSYGKDCASVCGKCFNTTACNKQNGTCPMMICDDRFEGSRCQQKVEKQSSLIGSVAVPVVGVIVGATIAAVLVILLFRWRKNKDKDEPSIDSPTTALPMNTLDEVKPSISHPVKEDESENVYYDFLSRKMDAKLCELWDYINFKKTNDNFLFYQEFSQLATGLQKPYTAALDDKNKGKNRYKGLYAYDHSRVPLKVEQEGEVDYINASFIDGFEIPKKFIASQGPTKVMVDDFWRMVWQQRVMSIVMLTNIIEQGTEKCILYWPLDGEETRGNITIRLLSEDTANDYTFRYLKLKKAGTDEVLLVTQYHYRAWPDKLCPNTTWSLVRFWSKVNESIVKMNGSGPITVHCSAGVGRTGTFIAMDNAYHQLQSEDALNMLDIVMSLREQRVNMVQTKDQYVYVHEAVADMFHFGTHFIWTSQFEEVYEYLSESDIGSRCTRLQQQYELIVESVAQKRLSVIAVEENCHEYANVNILCTAKPSTAHEYMPKSKRQTFVQEVGAMILQSFDGIDTFIMCKPPEKSSMTEFWSLVEEQNVRVIVSLADSSPFASKKSSLLGLDNTVLQRRFGLVLAEEKNTCAFQETKIEMRNSMDDNHVVSHFEYTNWAPKGNVPKDTTSMIQLIEAVMARQPRLSSTEPILVYCTEGVKRSGLVCTLLSEIIKINREGGHVNIIHTVKMMKERNDDIVGTFDQYQYIYDVLLERLKENIYQNQ